MSVYGGLYTGIDYAHGGLNSESEIAALDQFLDNMVSENKQDSVVSIFIMPSTFFTLDDTAPHQEVTYTKPNMVDGYTPRNKKLLTYPYCFLNVDCITDNHVYHYEWFDNEVANTFTFDLWGCVTPNPEIICVPRHYDRSELGNYTEQLTMSGWPQVAFTIDAYRAWLAQDATRQRLGLLGTTVAGLASVASGNLAGAALSAVGAWQQYNQMVIDSTKGSTARGNTGSSANAANRSKEFYFKYQNITQEYAKMIDGFFDMYGYAQGIVAVPNIWARPKWTYVKTKDVVITGSIPADDMAKIETIYNSGITFWEPTVTVGDYSGDNSPITGGG